MELVRKGVLALLLFSIITTPAIAENVVLVNGTIVDGTGKPRTQGSIRIKDGKITDIGLFRPAAGEATIDIKGLIVAPGFIDIDNHSAEGLKAKMDASSQVMQGITTAVLGADGTGPIAIENFMLPFDEAPPVLNIAAFVGHGTVRRAVMRDDYKRAATPDEIARMEQLVEGAMREGAYGLSSSLGDDPGFYATADELLALAKVTARYGGIYAISVRGPSVKVLESINEAIDIGRRTKVPIHISHLRLGSVAVLEKAAQALAQLDQARAQGIDITADVSPHSLWSSKLASVVPSGKVDDAQVLAQVLDDLGGAKNVVISKSRTLEDLAGERNATPAAALSEMLTDAGARATFTSLSDKDVRTFLRHRLVMAASDSGIDVSDPRAAGTFPKILGQLVREEKLLTLESAIQKMTGMPAARLGLKERGVLRRGAPADIVVLDAAQVRDKATFDEPLASPEGIKYVFVNGTMVVQEGHLADERPGLALR
jgi:N-acyl-D-amino-acid deacylase